MDASSNSGAYEQPNTYFAQNASGDSELTRLTIQDRLLTAGMGGPLAEQTDPARFQRILDIGCGTGTWAIELAGSYPHMSLHGIDINARMITYAREQAQAQQMAERVQFQVMDALLLLEFPDAFFDLVNIRLGVSYLRTWDWPKLISEMLRVTRLKGIIRVTEPAVGHTSNGPAHSQLMEIAVCSFYRAGHLFELETNSVMQHLPELLTRHGVKNVQTKSHALQFRGGTPEGKTYSEDVGHAFQTGAAFFKKRGCAPANYDEVYQQALVELQQPDFLSTWPLLTAWGEKSF